MGAIQSLSFEIATIARWDYSPVKIVKAAMIVVPGQYAAIARSKRLKVEKQGRKKDWHAAAGDETSQWWDGLKSDGGLEVVHFIRFLRDSIRIALVLPVAGTSRIHAIH